MTADSGFPDMKFKRNRNAGYAVDEAITLEYRDLSNGTKLPLLTFPALSGTGIVTHGFTTRRGGVSEGIFASLNLGFGRGDDPEAVKENFRRTAEALDIDRGLIVCSHQTHTTNVRIVTEEDAGKGVTRPRTYSDVDGLVTDIPGLVLATFFADCVPLFFVDPIHRAIGMSHSGWRGTVERMGARTLEVMADAYDTRPEDVICAIGPSICQNCYEVSGDVAEAFAREFAGSEREILIARKAGQGLDEESIRQDGAESKYLLDLWKTNEIVLLDAGVLPEHLTVTDICTCCNPNLLFSHRASQGKRGNLGAFLSLNEA
ncbi:MAG: peptidoglycan editing factor PgeF [Lachnospiraceae bacterium]|nr:peptidoglycan editing factor PgeF [Lachnospiraceae bacterium]